MSISLSKYVDITSGLGGGAVATTRSLVGRFFTGSELVSPGTFISFSTAAAVGDFFGTSSEEYARAQFYFGWVSKNITKPQSIQFARWVDVAVSPMIFGSTNTGRQLSDWTSITTGSLGMTIGSDVETFTGIDFSTATSLTDVATILQTKIRTASGAVWTSATVTWNATRGSFDFEGSSAGDATISVQEGVGGVPIGGVALLGWLPESENVNGSLTLPLTDGALWVDGAAVQSITACLQASADASNNFGSFLFLRNLSLTLDEHREAAAWNEEQNVMYMYCVGVTAANVSAWTNVSTGLGGYGGVGITLYTDTAQYPDQIPMMIEAATDYTRENSVQNYMYQVFPTITPGVTTDASSDAYDSLAVNYIGATQTAGQTITFYQRGELQGSTSPTNITDMNAYVNEIWLKDAAGVAILNLLLGLAQVPANNQGRGQILGALQAVIDQALLNGTISVGKTLTAEQQAFITSQTNDNKAWYQVQNSGYWIDCIIEVIPASDPVEYQANYLLIYSKDDVIRKVVGTHTLI